QSEFSSPKTGLIVLVFQKGDDPIVAINHMMSFLTAVVTSRVTIQPIQGRQNSITVGSSRPCASGSGEDLEVHNQDNITNNLMILDMQEPSTSAQSTILTQSDTKITSDSNIISYAQYMNESQYNTVQNSGLPALQDDLILSVIEQLKT
nr:hypothetical protein [Tanacetum cinerariifolium]